MNRKLKEVFNLIKSIRTILFKRFDFKLLINEILEKIAEILMVREIRNTCFYFMWLIFFLFCTKKAEIFTPEQIEGFREAFLLFVIKFYFFKFK